MANQLNIQGRRCVGTNACLVAVVLLANVRGGAYARNLADLPYAPMNFREYRHEDGSWKGW